MAADIPSLRYAVPKTVFGVTFTRRAEVVSKDGRSSVGETTDVTAVPRLVADAGGRYLTDVRPELLEKVSLEVTLSEDGVIESIGTDLSRDPTPVIALAAKIASVAVAFGFREDNSLEARWVETHKRLSDTLTALEARIADHLGRITAEQTTTGDVVASGQALQVLQREAAAIDRLRREWIAGHAVAEAESATLAVADLARLRLESTLPASMTDTDFHLPPAMAALAGKFKALIAIADPHRADERPDRPESHLEDLLVLRRSRPVEIGVYRGAPGENTWTLVGEPARLDVVDAYSHYDLLSLDGRWFSERSVEMSFHPDHSLKTWKVTSTSTVGAVATSLGSLVDVAGEWQKKRAERPDPAAEELAAAKLKLDLLTTSSEYAQLSATQDRGAELAELEQRVKLADLYKKV